VSSLPSPGTTPGAQLEELYQSVILDHNRRPRNHGELEGASSRAEGRNPVCGDEVTVWVRMDGDVIADVRFKGIGCAISRASASMMTTAVKGKTRSEAATLFEQFHGLVTGNRGTEAGQLGSLEAFSGVSRFPVRVKCASLSWHALRSALREGAADSISG
jgi:nitrogen fixation protein NifU and related proteins